MDLETQENTSQEEIELHPEQARLRQDTYSSLTDISGIDLFSDELKALIQSLKEEELQSGQILREKVFVNGVTLEISAFDGLAGKLFAYDEERVLLQDYRRGEEAFSIWDLGLILAAVLAVAALYLCVFGRKK